MFQRDNSINQLKAGVVLSYSSMFLSYIIAIIYTPLMLRLLGQSEYGLYNLVSSVVSYLGLFSFGFGSAYMRYYLRYKVNKEYKEIAKLNGMFLIIFSVIALIAVIAGLILVNNLAFILGEKLAADDLATAKTLMVIMVINMALSFPGSIFNLHITANEKFVFQKVLQMIKTIINPFVMLPVLLMGYKSIGIVVVTAVLTLLIECCNIIFCFKKLKISFNFHQFDISLMTQIASFSSFIFINMVIDQVNWNVDKFLLGRYRGTVAVAIYGLAAQLNFYYISLSTVISNVFIPRVNRMVVIADSPKELTDLITRVGRIQFIILSLISSGLIFFGKPFVQMWAGVEYSESYIIVLLLIIPVTIPLIQNIGIEIQKAKNMHQFRSWVLLFIAIGNICISIPLTRIYGGRGAALGTAISLLLGNGLIINWFYNCKVGLNMKYFWSQILRFVPSLLPPMGVGIMIHRLSIDLYHPLPFLAWGIVYVITFCFSMWFMGMNRYEKNLISKPVLKVFRSLVIYLQNKIKGRNFYD